MRHDVTFPLYVEVDEIYNLACPASPIHYQRDPVQTTKTSVHGAINMLGLAKRTGATILQASTSEVYGDPEVHPQTEDYWGNVNPIGPRSCYDEGKRCAETLFFDYHRQHGLDIKVARIFNTYGPRMHPNDGRVVSQLHRAGAAGRRPHHLRRRPPDPLVLLRGRPDRRPGAADEQRPQTSPARSTSATPTSSPSANWPSRCWRLPAAPRASWRRHCPATTPCNASPTLPWRGSSWAGRRQVGPGRGPGAHHRLLPRLAPVGRSDPRSRGCGHQPATIATGGRSHSGPYRGCHQGCLCLVRSDPRSR